MTEYPVTDPAEIAKLPIGGIYETARKAKVIACGGGMFRAITLGGTISASRTAESIAESHGGIACRLVPGTQLDALAGLLRDLADVADEKAWTAFALAGLLEEWLPKARAALAKLEENDA